MFLLVVRSSDIFGRRLMPGVDPDLFRVQAFIAEGIFGLLPSTSTRVISQAEARLLSVNVVRMNAV